MKYTVHIYPIVRVTFSDVEANSQEEAMKKAEDGADFHETFDRLAVNVEYAEDIDCFHVDEENDPEYARSVWYDKHNKPL
ncbi:hypothetical protein LCGC14_1805530 [marine sediment metagenome]|uniref:Uncharacterized protein n=1 Tax=marine sediment metagenome TaxID=412755 RepID=A0A0F9HB80_9ZZZZ